MNHEHATDPSGAYTVDEVTLTVNGLPIAKGEGATGVFLEIGRDATHDRTTTGSDGEVTRSPMRDPRRLMAVVLLRSSAGNAILRDIRQTGRVAVLRVVRPQDGAPLLKAEVLMVNDGSPQDVGHDELRWNLTVIG
jgi:hypothetical protein